MSESEILSKVNKDFTSSVLFKKIYIL
jgi:hypothetical protein